MSTNIKLGRGAKFVNMLSEDGIPIDDVILSREGEIALLSFQLGNDSEVDYVVSHAVMPVEFEPQSEFEDDSG